MTTNIIEIIAVWVFTYLVAGVFTIYVTDYPNWIVRLLIGLFWPIIIISYFGVIVVSALIYVFLQIKKIYKLIKNK